MVTILKIKVLPESNENIKNLKGKIKRSLEKEGAKNITQEEEEIAFGLKALIVTIAWPEELDTGKAEEIIKSIEGVSSLDIIDYRRAFG